VTRRLERKPDHDLVRSLLGEDPGEGRSVGVQRRAATTGRQRRRATVMVRDRDPDPPLPEVQTQQAAHDGVALGIGRGDGRAGGAAEPLGPALGSPLGLAPASVATVMVKRESMLDTVDAQSGQSVTMASPYGCKATTASAAVLPFTTSRSFDASTIATSVARAVARNDTVPSSPTTPSPTSMSA
jgi:hypothetical protein